MVIIWSRTYNQEAKDAFEVQEEIARSIAETFRQKAPPPRNNTQADAYPKVAELARKALSLDPLSADGHVKLGMVNLLYRWDWLGAEREFREAIRLDPTYTIAIIGIHTTWWRSVDSRNHSTKPRLCKPRHSTRFETIRDLWR